MVDEEMVEAVQVFLDTIRRDYKPGDVLVVEQRFDLSSWYPGLFGKCDAVLYRPSTGELRVYDLKYGRGVPVEVERNSQELYYGIGATMAEPGRLVNTGGQIGRASCRESVGQDGENPVGDVYF